MSRVAIFSDIHANLAALKSVIADAETQGVSSFACLGDIIGYGPNPSDCVTLVQSLKCPTVKGNHDQYAEDDYNLDNLNDQAQEAMMWTRNNLSANQKNWLANLPYTRRLGRNTLVHATEKKPENWEYIRNSFDAVISLQSQTTPICFYGHTHVPVAYELRGTRAQTVEQETVNIELSCKYLINVGSVGQPRDGDPKASYVIFDRIKRCVEFKRVKYDIDTVINDIRNTGLPESLAERLIEAS